jgi:hypothetical protein
MAEVQAFYDAHLPRVEPAVECLKQLPPDGKSEPEKNLFNLTLMLVVPAKAVELFKTEPEVIDGFDLERFVAMHLRGEV